MVLVGGTDTQRHTTTYWCSGAVMHHVARVQSLIIQTWMLCPSKPSVESCSGAGVHENAGTHLWTQQTHLLCHQMTLNLLWGRLEIQFNAGFLYWSETECASLGILKGGPQIREKCSSTPGISNFRFFSIIFCHFLVKIRQHAFKPKCSYTVFSKQNTRKTFSTYSPSQRYVYTYVRTLKLVLRGQIKHARTGTYTDRLHVNTWDGH